MTRDQSELLSSISRKLKPMNIEVFSGKNSRLMGSTRVSEFGVEKNRGNFIGCFVEMPVMVCQAEQKNNKGGLVDY